MQQLPIFVRYYDSEKNATDTCFVNTSDLLFESENTAPDSESIYLTLKNLIVNDLLLRLLHFQIFCSEGGCHVSLLEKREALLSSFYKMINVKIF